MDVLYPVLLCLALGGFATFLCAHVYHGEERRWLLTWLWVALVLRLAVAAMFGTFPETRVFHEDANGYEWFGMAIARGWHGAHTELEYIAENAQNYGYKYVAAAIYYVFGQFAPLAACFNCVVGTVSVFLVYHLARQFFHAVVARRAALLTTLVPSMILWNAMALKESIMNVLILVALLSCVSLKRRFSVWPIVGIAASIAAMQPIRYYMVYFLGCAVVLSLFFERGVGMVSGVYKQVLLVGAVVALLAVTGIAGSVDRDAGTMTLARVSQFRQGMAVTANTGFSADVDISTPGGALLFLPIGMANLLLGPFPWQMGSLRALLTAPETVYWWLLFPSLIRGLIGSIRSRFAETSPLILFTGTLTVAYSLMHGNVGSGFRQRSQIFIILFIFTAYGVLKRRAEKIGVDPTLLLVDRGKAPATSPSTVAKPVTS
jgi:hypothetical protein